LGSSKQWRLNPKLSSVRTFFAMSNTKNLTVQCKHCGKDNVFDQPYAYHAGFADQGFLYNDAGTLTLVWSMFDPVFDEMFPGETPWTLVKANQRRFEKMLQLAPSGGRWKFSNPARCIYCAKPISEPMLKSIHYFVYPGSIVTDNDHQLRLREYLIPPPKIIST
jgi:hypothetical protein